jgi:hypothetical protein
MTLTAPYPPELIRVAKKVVWYDGPEEALSDLPAFLAQVMVYGSPADVSTVERHVPPEEFSGCRCRHSLGVTSRMGP